MKLDQFLRFGKKALVGCLVGAACFLPLTAEAYTYDRADLGITIELDNMPMQTKDAPSAVYLRYPDRTMMIGIEPQMQPAEEFKAYLGKTAREIKQQLVSYQRETGMMVLDVQWIEGGKYPILLTEGKNKHMHVLTAAVLTEEKICRVLALSKDRLAPIQKQVHIDMAKTLVFTEAQPTEPAAPTAEQAK